MALREINNDNESEGMNFMPSPVNIILFLNIIAYFTIDPGSPAFDMFALWPADSPKFHIWQLVSYMFLHGSLSHIVLNMLGFWMFGADLQEIWGGKAFTIFYFMCGIAGALVGAVTNPMGMATIGASAAVFGILIAYGMLFPSRYLLFSFFIPIKAKNLSVLIVCTELVMGLYYLISGQNMIIGHWVHLGGGAAGYLFVIINRYELTLRTAPKFLQQQITTLFNTIAKRKSAKTGDSRRESVEIDNILDKISDKGYESLTPKERQILLNAGK